MAVTIDLDDRAWFDAIPVDGIGVHVVEGETLRYRDSVCGGNDLGWWWMTANADGLWVNKIARPSDDDFHDPGDWRSPKATLRPPPEWVALSEQMPHPECSCERQHLGGHPITSTHATGCPWYAWRLGSCRPFVQVTVPCHHKYINEATGRCVWDGKDCFDGRVSIGSVTVEVVVPIVRQQSTTTTMTGRWLTVFLDGLVHWQESDGVTLTTRPERIDLGPNPEQYVGKWAVICRRAS